MPISFNKLVLGGGAGGGMSVGKLPIDLTTPTPTPTATEAPTATPSPTATSTPTPTLQPNPTPTPTATGAITGTTLWSWGRNTDGRLGINSQVHRSSPGIVGSSATWSKLFDSPTGGHHAAIDASGNMYMWGSGTAGQLGQNKAISQSSPIQVISSVTSWSMAALAGTTTYALDNEGKLWTWGNSGNGGLGVNTSSHRSSPVMLNAGPWVHVCAGTGFGAAIKSDKTLWVWGQNTSGQLGLNTTTNATSITQVSGAFSYAFGDGASLFAIKSDESLWATGFNQDGRLGDDTTVHRSSFVQIAGGGKWMSGACSNGSAFAIKQDQTLWSWGWNAYGQLGQNDKVHRSSPTQEPSLSKWLDVTGGLQAFIALKNNMSLWSVGRNDIGGLGLNDKVHRSSFAQISNGSYSWTKIGGVGGTFLAIREFPTITPYPSPTVTSATATPTATPTPTPSPTPSPTPNASFPAGNSVAFISNDRSVAPQNFMYSFAGTIEKLDTPSSNRSVTFVPSNSFFIIDSTGTAYGFGSNDRGQLGDVSTTDKPASSPSQVIFGNWKQITLSANRTVAGIQNPAGGGMPQKLYVWGSGGAALAQGSANFQSSNRSSPILTCMGDTTTWAKVSLGAYNAGTHAAIEDTTGNGSGKLFMWGNNYYGSLGVDDTVHRSSPIQVMTGGTWTDVVASYAYVLAIKNDGTLWSWGANSNGQLGHNTAVDLAQSGCSSPVQVGTRNDWVSVFSGDQTSFAIDYNTALWAWGNNYYGNLGNNNTARTSSPIQVGTGTGWSKVVSDGNIVYALKTNGTLWTWGAQSHDGSSYTNAISSPVQVSGVTNNGKYIDITTRGRVTGSSIETYAIWQQLN